MIYNFTKEWLEKWLFLESEPMVVPDRMIPEGTDPSVCLDCDNAPACPLVFPQCLGKIIE